MNKLLYFIGCIGARLSIAILAKYAPRSALRWMGYVALLPAIGFSYLFLSGARKGKGAFGEKIWWEWLRPVHATLYFLFAWYAIQGNRNAWLFLLVDILIGTIGFVYVHSKQGDFRSFL
jgi:hypothetical protein